MSKTRPADDIRTARVAGGLADFGENYLQEALDKITQLQDLDLTWHFIGPVQANKTRAIAENFSWVHTVEREKIARRLNDQRPDELPPLQVCIQVNISGEASKSGVSPDRLAPLVDAVAAMPRLRLRGLMAIPAAGGDEDTREAAFRALRECLEQVRGRAPGMDTLSMGMSGDLEAAIRQGATIIRVGTAIFGPRDG